MNKRETASEFVTFTVPQNLMRFVDEMLHNVETDYRLTKKK